MVDRRGSSMACLAPHKLSSDQRSRLLELLSDTFYVQGCLNFPTLALRCVVGRDVICIILCSDGVSISCLKSGYVICIIWSALCRVAVSNILYTLSHIMSSFFYIIYITN